MNLFYNLKKKVLKIEPRDIFFFNGVLLAISLLIFHAWWILPVNIFLFLLQIYVTNMKKKE